MYRENITASRSYYSGNSNSEEKRTADETKAPFFKQLVPLAQKKMEGIR
jgi:hypothetical protein